MRHPVLVLVLLATVAALSGCQDDRSLPMSPDEGAPKVGRWADYDVQLFDVDLPGAVDAEAYGINARGDVVGLYRDSEAGYAARGFLWSGGAFHPVAYPGAEQTAARGINERGDIVGTWHDGVQRRGFLLHNGEYSSISREGAQDLVPWGINPDGTIVGNWVDAVGVRHGFLLSDGVFDSFDIPVDGRIATYPMGVDPDGNIAGYFTLPAPRYYGAFIRRADGTIITDVEPPVPDVPFWFTDVNPRGDVSGGYFSWAEGRYIGFVRDSHGAYTEVEAPGLEPPHNEGYSINASGVMVGTAWSPTRPYIAVPVN